MAAEAEGVGVVDTAVAEAVADTTKEETMDGKLYRRYLEGSGGFTLF